MPKLLHRKSLNDFFSLTCWSELYRVGDFIKYIDVINFTSCTYILIHLYALHIHVIMLSFII